MFNCVLSKTRLTALVILFGVALISVATAVGLSIGLRRNRTKSQATTESMVTNSEATTITIGITLTTTVTSTTISPEKEPNHTCRFIVQPPIPPKNPAESYGFLQVQAGDFDEDHLLDLVYVRPRTPVIELFLGYNNNSFEAHQEYAVNGLEDEKNLMQLMFIADLNHDHHLDLVWKHHSNDQMDIGYGYGNGSFGVPVSFSTAKQSYGTEVVLGDLNNDTYPDLVIALLVEKQIVIHLGRKNAGFPSVPDKRVNIRMNLASLALADFNSDGTLDLVYGAEQGNFSILLGVGDASFHLEHSYSVPSKQPLERAMPSDLNGDALVDIVFTHFGATRLAVMLNDGNREFRSIAFDHKGTINTDRIKMGYLDDDSHLDIAALIDFGRKIKIYYGFGNGSFAASENSIVFEAHRSEYLELGDFNGDRRLDLVIVFNDSLIILLNDC